MKNGEFYEFMSQTLAGDVVPVLYRRAKIAKTTEAEFRWKRAHNSRFSLVKTAYGVSDQEHVACFTLFATACQTRGIAAEYIPPEERHTP